MEEEINLFLESWGSKEMINFLNDVIPVLELYNVDENDDWVKTAVGEENERNVRLIRTVYLISRLAESHAGKLSLINMRFKGLWKRIEKEVDNLSLPLEKDKE